MAEKKPEKGKEVSGTLKSEPQPDVVPHLPAEEGSVVNGNFQIES